MINTEFREVVSKEEKGRFKQEALPAQSTLYS
jgi:hypothetical protein